MTVPARRAFLAALALGLAACGGGPEKKPDRPAGGEAAASPGGPTAPPENLILDRDTNQLLLDLDRYTEDWQLAREERRVAAYGGLERLIRRLVEENLDKVLALVADDKNPRGRLIAAKALGFSRDPRAIQALVALLSLDAAALLENALMGIALQARATVPADQVAFHLESFDPRVQRNAALALYRIVRKGAPLSDRARERAVARLSLLVLDQKEPALRGNAAAALGEIGSEINENDLLNLLRDDDVYPKLRAIIALAKLGTDRCLEPLVQMLGATEANVRDLAAKTLWIVTRRLGYGIDGTALGEDASAWRDAIAARRAGG